GVTSRYPRIEVIVPHIGGTLPLLVERVDANIARRRASGAPVAFEGPLSVQVRRLWFDTVNAYPPAVQCACHAWRPDCLFLGTHCPYPPEGGFEPLVGAPAAIGLAEREPAAILVGSAQKLLRLRPAAV